MSILLNTLKDGLDPQYQSLLETDPQLLARSQQYLQELLINDDLLSTEAFMASSVSLASDKSTSFKTSNANSVTGSTAELVSPPPPPPPQPQPRRTLIEEIAELDMNHREINRKLSAITDSNRDLIIDISNDLHIVNSQLSHEYQSQLESISKLLESDVLTTQPHAHPMNAIEINNSILENIDSVLDILELPTLCKVCILQGNYQESLEISMLIQALIIRFPKLTIFKQIHAQIELELKLMVKGLIRLLNTNLKQNNILKIFQILNKLDLLGGTSNLVFNDTQQAQKTKFLKIIYLNSRYKFISNEVSSLKPLIKFNKLTYLKRFIETYREYIFNSLSIFNTIFKSTPSNLEDDENNLLINQFIRNLANLLCQELKTHLPEIKPEGDEDSEVAEIDLHNQIDGLILQIIYLCKSLASFHVDFEPIIVTELCHNTNLISEASWANNLAKVKKHR
ncbi:uncharacterized protein SPAPADRAFT_62552 [Spathaspora passalidarum NRRL Y-27907]|uniref:Conserved oligomeric Golgi complex subunit 8 n=1 Tax=Spathaspora passalidarum (strain NRRL Y-27907 / 11-Y1) TaxID=619300 RepID=G3ASJ8_SPAPN|nr:uncharacterized protein SPAPADRAFT_62552 [Spathaspora passalidarum NRRL Y-27907]EGW30684.1 hypothetical protein SPAPADRAFT_62552 [Spathaspora passalidarum NRRL Y-27907]